MPWRPGSVRTRWTSGSCPMSSKGLTSRSARRRPSRYIMMIDGCARAASISPCPCTESSGTSFIGRSPPSGRGRVSSRITGIHDKGPERGLLVVCEQVLRDADSGAALATNILTNFARADGGIGFSTGPQAQPHPAETARRGDQTDDPSGARAALPAVRRSKSAARSAGRGARGGLSPAHPPWDVHIWLRHQGDPPSGLRFRPGPAAEHRGAGQRARLPRGRP